MWPFINQINLNRYLIVWQVNRSLVKLPPCLAVELSWVLATIIAERLPTSEARPWRKALAAWEGYLENGALPGKKGAPVPEAAWPLEAVLFVYPGKQIYGQGELIVWELKLIGASADHELFLQLILPAMEQAGQSTDPRWHRPNSLWGRFDIRAIYMARGPRWEPLAQAGKVDLRIRPTPNQWAIGLELDVHVARAFDRLTWLTPFDFGGRKSEVGDRRSEVGEQKSEVGSRRADRSISDPQSPIPNPAAPTLPELIEALAERLICFIPTRRHKAAEVWEILSAEDQAALRGAIEQAAQFPLRRQKIEAAPQGWPGKWIGEQTFLFIPDPLIPYLELASILHLGRQTHFGCGTFVIA